MDVLREFLEFIEYSKPQPVADLLRRVLLKSRRLTDAEAGSVFIARGNRANRRLEAADTQNDRIELELTNFVVPINKESIAGYTAATAETVFVADLYNIPERLPFKFDPSFDREHGYKSRSMLSFPLLNHDRNVIGVVQLINRLDPVGNGPVPFEREQADLIVPFNHIVGGAIERADMLDRISAQNVRLRDRNRLLREQRARIAALQDETEEAFQLSINLLSRAAELHDENTARHVLRVNEYSNFLAEEIGMPRAFCDEIRYSAQLHDVGKMSVNVAILRKRGPLDDEERAEMMRHPEYGFQILSASDRLKMAAEIALNHHEQWNGGGYPVGRAGEQIPVSARIAAVADIYDAIRSPRPYKPGFTHEQTVKVLLEGDDRFSPGDHLDPKLLEIFAAKHQGMAVIWARFQDR
ncbi:MAG: HD domain-containing protein [Thermoanaerobaculales bacterium]|nr:HD domain-containing protein [Thermoanaerobaculales bacterium]